MSKLKYLLTAIVALSIFVACSDDDDVDTTPPAIEIVEPKDHDEFHPGETFHLKANLTDETELASWKVEIHYDGDGHTHSQLITLKSGDLDEEGWAFDKNETIEGNVKTYELHLDIEIPDDAKHGEYHLGVYAVDEAGNQNQAYIEIEIEDEEDHHHED